MGYKKSGKTIERHPVSGIYHAKDIEDNREVSPSELINRAEQRLNALKEAIGADSGEMGKAGEHEEFHKGLGDSMDRQPRPYDADHPNSKTEGDVRYGMAVKQDHEAQKVDRFGRGKN